MEGQQNQLIQMVGVSGGDHKSGLHSGSSTLKDKPLVVEPSTQVIHGFLFT
jgi:hypothetical protein